MTIFDSDKKKEKDYKSCNYADKTTSDIFTILFQFSQSNFMHTIVPVNTLLHSKPFKHNKKNTSK